ncbi:MAG: hypothetical protein KDB00_11745, partial [Planctomycetales bacterium]|nr:hypothetical protein [Planctomycetales bacterium]
IASAPVNSPYSSYYGSSVAPATYNAPTYGTYNMPLTGSTQTLPLATPPRRTFGSGLSRFFNSLLGRNTNYVTSYYQAPITYYRPMTGIDPATGTTVTVQQPCSSYVQQLQRVPYNSFLPLDAGTTPLLTSPDACSNPMMIGGVSSQTVLPYSSTPGSFAPPSNIVGQVGGEVPLGEYGVSPIPTEFPEAGYPNSAPLTGGSSSDPTLNAPDAADRVPMAPPELKSEKPAADTPDDSATTEAETPRSYFNEFYGDDVYPYGKLNPSYNDNDNADKESGESNPPAGPAIRLDPPVTNIFQNRQQQLTTSTPPPVKSLDNVPHETIQNYSTLRPIGGPADRQDQQLGLSAPLQQPDDDVINAPRTIQPPSTRTFQAPPLPAPSQRGPDPSALFRNTESSASSRSPAPNRVSVPVREATTRHQNVRQVAAWDELPRLPAPRANSSNPVATPSTRPASPVKRDNSDWRPAP